MDITSLYIKNEWDLLKQVIVGTAKSWGPLPSPEDAFDPKSKEHLIAGTYPSESSITIELEKLVSILTEKGIEVFRPEVIKDLNQVFSRDVGFVINNTFIRSSMISDRSSEWDGIHPLLSKVEDLNIVTPPPTVRVEGGDVMPFDNELWLGYSEEPDFRKYRTSRTNKAAIQWFTDQFPELKIRSFELSKSDTNPRINALHLDCCLSILSGGQAIFHPAGFKNQEDIEWIRNRFIGKIHEVSSLDMYNMNCNILSISTDTIISGEGFDRVNSQLKSWGYTVIETPFHETAKLEGLFRCATLPIKRKK